MMSQSSVETELIILAQGIGELIWLKRMLNELLITNDGPMRLYCDNKATINSAHNPIHLNRTKHV